MSKRLISACQPLQVADFSINANCDDRYDTKYVTKTEYKQQDCQPTTVTSWKEKDCEAAPTATKSKGWGDSKESKSAGWN